MARVPPGRHLLRQGARGLGKEGQGDGWTRTAVGGGDGGDELRGAAATVSLISAVRGQETIARSK